MISSPQRFPKSYRLRSKADFASIRKGKRIRVGQLRITYCPNDLEYSRIGFAVSRKYGNAVERNRLKRQLRSCFRCADYHHMHMDILVIPAAGCAQMQHARDDFTQALKVIARRQAALH